MRGGKRIKNDDFRQWNDIDNLPDSHDCWEIWSPFAGRVSATKSDVANKIKTWHITNPILIGTPGARKLLPPVFIPDAGEKILSRIVKDGNITVSILCFIFLAMAAAASFKVLKWNGSIIIVGAITLHLAFESFVVYRKRNNIEDRAMFLYWTYTNKRSAGRQLAMLMLFSGSAQYLATIHLGSTDLVVLNYGLHFKSASSGELWRYITGPFFHSGFSHWVTNTITGVFAASLTGSLTGARWVIYFISSAIISSIPPGIGPLKTSADAFVGLSGGVYGLLGASMIFSYINKKILPEHLWISLLNFSIVNMACSAVAVENSNTAAHISGFLAGALASALFDQNRQSDAI